MAEAFGGYAVEFKLDCPHILVGVVILSCFFSNHCGNI